MKAHNSGNFNQGKRDESAHSIAHGIRNKILNRRQEDLKKNEMISRSTWWKRTSEVAVAALLGVIAVWGLQEYRQLTALSLEMGSSVNSYENAELRVIKFMDSQNLIQNTGIQHDLKEIEQTQVLLKQALLYTPENKKEWIYKALIKTYELKLQILERTFRYGDPEYHKTRKVGTPL